MILTDEKRIQFNKYYDLLTDWNQRMNLTTITDRDEVWLKHFEDSVSIERILDMRKVQSVIDVGTGAGFPGIPLKIMYPHIRLTLLDSLEKRVRFLETVVHELGFSDDVAVVHGRAEDIGRDPVYREQYDLCVSRAVAELSVLSELCIPFIRVGGYFVAYKSEKAKTEIEAAGNAIKLLGGHTDSTETFTLKEQEHHRTLIRILKDTATDERYPRRAGIPSKRPLV